MDAGVLESLTEAVLVTDALGFVRYLNSAGEELTGWTSAEVAGKSIEDALPPVSYQAIGHRKPNFGMNLDRGWKGAAIVLDRNRQRLMIEIESSPIVDKGSGSTTGLVCVIRKAKSRLWKMAAVPIRSDGSTRRPK